MTIQKATVRTIQRVVKHRRAVWLRVVMTLAALCTSAALADVSGSADYAGFQRFPGSTIVDYRVDESTVYTLPLGRMQRAAGQVAPSQAERFQGTLRRITYEIPDGFSGQEVYNHFRAQLLAGEQRELFACQGRGCGSSNYWANDVFNNRILYGPETSQYYMASTYHSAADDSAIGYAALYVVTRGNRRMYAHLDFLELSAARAAEQRMGMAGGPEAMALRLEQDGAVSIPGLVFDENDRLSEDEGLALVQELMQNQGLLEGYVVAHLQGGDRLDRLLERSSDRAEQVVSRLVDAGVDAARLEARGVGPLAPYCRPGPCSQRIELVRR